MCEVVKSNFDDTFAIIEDAIRNAKFIALDTEFSGLTFSEADQGSLFDLGEARYAKLRHSIQAFTITQFGLSAFCEDDKFENTYQAHSFNCYLYPTAFGSIDVRFLCQTSSLQFLTQYRFDFNKFVYEGIPFMNEQQEQQLRESFLKPAFSRSNELIPVSPALQPCCAAISDWVTSAVDDATLSLETSPRDLDCTALFDLRLRFPQIWTDVVDDKIVVTKVSPEKRMQLEADQKYYEDTRVLGFTRVFRLLVKYKKPLVGHNSFMDLMFIYEKFYKPLPESYSKFKAEIHRLFPIVIDTKHVSLAMRQLHKESGLFTSTGLTQLYEAMDSSKGLMYTMCTPTISHAPTCKKYKDMSCPHEAGYDAYMCGYVLLRMGHILAGHGTKSVDARPFSFIEYLSVLSQYINKINLIRAGIDFVQLDGKDCPSDEMHWLHVRSKKALHLSNLAELIEHRGSADLLAKDSRQAVIAVKGNKCARDILADFKSNETIVVMRYNPWKHNRMLRSTIWAGACVSALAFGLAIWSSVPAKPHLSNS